MSVWREPIRLGEVEGQLKPSVFTELHEDTEIVSEGKLQVATGDGRLERLLDRLLRVKSDGRIGDPLSLVQRFRGLQILAREGEKIAG